MHISNTFTRRQHQHVPIISFSTTGKGKQSFALWRRSRYNEDLFCFARCGTVLVDMIANSFKWLTQYLAQTTLPIKIPRVGVRTVNHHPQRCSTNQVSTSISTTKLEAVLSKYALHWTASRSDSQVTRAMNLTLNEHLKMWKLAWRSSDWHVTSVFTDS